LTVCESMISLMILFHRNISPGQQAVWLSSSPSSCGSSCRV